MTLIRSQRRFSFRSHQLMSLKHLLSKFAVLWPIVLLRLLTYYSPSAESIEISRNSCHKQILLQIINISNLKPSGKSSWCMPKYKICRILMCITDALIGGNFLDKGRHCTTDSTISFTAAILCFSVAAR